MVYGSGAIVAGLGLLAWIAREERISPWPWLAVLVAAWSGLHFLLGVDFRTSGVLAIWGTLAALFFGVTAYRMWKDARAEKSKP